METASIEERTMKGRYVMVAPRPAGALV